MEVVVTAACALATKDSRRADVSFIATRTEIQKVVRSGSFSELKYRNSRESAIETQGFEDGRVFMVR
jgi:predicted RNA methylase